MLQHGLGIPLNVRCGHGDLPAPPWSQVYAHGMRDILVRAKDGSRTPHLLRGSNDSSQQTTEELRRAIPLDVK